MFPDLGKMERGWLILGYSFLFVEILQMTSDVLPAPAAKKNKRMREAVNSLILIINRAIIGNGLIRRSKKGPWRTHLPFEEALKAEKTCREITIILPEGLEGRERLKLFGKLKRICKGLLDGNCSAEEKEFMHQFCHDALGRVDEERFRLLDY